MYDSSTNITALIKSMHKVQGQVDGVAKTGTNPHFKNRYATLEAVVDAIRAPCQDAGLVVVQSLGDFKDGALSITTVLAHVESGEWMKSTLQIPVVKSDPQGIGSASTYGCRYSLMALFCLPAVDDDGEAAQRPATRPQPPVQQHTGINSPQPVFTSPLPAALASMRRESKTPDDLIRWFGLHKKKLLTWPKDDFEAFHAEYDTFMGELQTALRMAG